VSFGFEITISGGDPLPSGVALAAGFGARSNVNFASEWCQEG